MCVATFSGNKYGPIHSKRLEQSKNLALVQNQNDFDQNMVLTEQDKLEIKWWLQNVHKCYKEVFIGEPDKIIYTDSSKTGYGFHEPPSGRKGGGNGQQRKVGNI